MKITETAFEEFAGIYENSETVGNHFPPYLAEIFSSALTERL